MGIGAVEILHELLTLGFSKNCFGSLEKLFK